MLFYPPANSILPGRYSAPVRGRADVNQPSWTRRDQVPSVTSDRAKPLVSRLVASALGSKTWPVGRTGLHVLQRQELQQHPYEKHYAPSTAMTCGYLAGEALLQVARQAPGSWVSVFSGHEPWQGLGLAPLELVSFVIRTCPNTQILASSHAGSALQF